MWQKFLKDYFSFTKKERLGIIAVLTVILILSMLPFFFPYILKKEKTDASQFAKEIAQLQRDTSSEKRAANKYDNEFYDDYTPSSSRQITKPEIFFFDPNPTINHHKINS